MKKGCSFLSHYEEDTYSVGYCIFSVYEGSTFEIACHCSSGYSCPSVERGREDGRYALGCERPETRPLFRMDLEIEYVSVLLTKLRSEKDAKVRAKTIDEIEFWVDKVQQRREHLTSTFERLRKNMKKEESAERKRSKKKSSKKKKTNKKKKATKRS